MSTLKSGDERCTTMDPRWISFENELLRMSELPNGSILKSVRWYDNIRDCWQVELTVRTADQEDYLVKGSVSLARAIATKDFNAKTAVRGVSRRKDEQD